MPGASRYPKQAWLADLHTLLDEQDAARAAYREAADLIETDLQLRPDDARARAWLAVALAGLGEFDAALAQAQQARDAMPPERDALVGPLVRELYARVLLLRGDHDGALSELEALAAATGAATPYTWRLNPVWRELHAHPRFLRMQEVHDRQTQTLKVGADG